MPTRNANNKLVVLGSKSVLTRKSIKSRLDDVAASSVFIKERDLTSVEALLHAAKASGALWTIALVDGCPAADRRRIVPALIVGGVDDVLDVAHAAFLPSLDCAIANARATLKVARLIERTGLLLGESQPMLNLRKSVARAVLTPALPVLILGETGTGKGQVARAIHEADRLRNEHPLHTLDCGSITDTLFGSELFGHVRGAYTGALQNRRGAFESADLGTLLLDEVGELSPATQSYLLNALEERSYRPVGSDSSYPIRCRIVAATNRVLQDDVDAGGFRADLFHRLHGSCIRVPALRERISDATILFKHFIDQARKADSETEVDTEALDYLRSYGFPGNVRELSSIAQQTVARMGDDARVRLAHLPFDRMLSADSAPSNDESIEEMVEHGMQMRDIETEVTRQATLAAIKLWRTRKPDMSKTQVVKEVARSLGVSPRTIYNKLNGIIRPNS